MSFSFIGIANAAGDNSIVIEAESFDNSSGLEIKECSNNECFYVSGFKPWEWASFEIDKSNQISIPEAGDYTIEYRVSSIGGGGLLKLEMAGGGDFGTIEIPATGDDETWTTISHVVTLPSGDLGLAIKGMGENWNAWNLDWFSITKSTATVINSVLNQNEYDLAVYPNPARGEDVQINLSLEQAKEVYLSVINLAGFEAEVITKSYLRAGNYSFTLDGLHNAGVYFARLQVGEKQKIVKFIIE